MRNINPGDMRLVAMNLLARREHLRQEVFVKLVKRFGREFETEIDSVLDDLCSQQLLSDRRFVESFIAQRSGRGYGPERIRQELRHKGVKSDTVDSALDASDVDWQALAESVRAKKFGIDAPANFTEKARQLRFLTYRGFTADCAAMALESLQDVQGVS